jgi:hypothetical protein
MAAREIPERSGYSLGRSLGAAARYPLEQPQISSAPLHRTVEGEAPQCPRVSLSWRPFWSSWLDVGLLLQHKRNGRFRIRTKRLTHRALWSKVSSVVWEPPHLVSKPPIRRYATPRVARQRRPCEVSDCSFATPVAAIIRSYDSRPMAGSVLHPGCSGLGPTRDWRLVCHTNGRVTPFV